MMNVVSTVVTNTGHHYQLESKLVRLCVTLINKGFCQTLDAAQVNHAPGDMAPIV